MLLLFYDIIGQASKHLIRPVSQKPVRKKPDLSGFAKEGVLMTASPRVKDFLRVLHALVGRNIDILKRIFEA